MASALLASRNEPHWGEEKVYMRKTPNSNPNPKKQIYNDHLSSQINGRQSVSNDSSSHNRKPNTGREFLMNRHVTFNISSYSKRELKDLKKRLVFELEQVRNLSNRIESRDLQARSGYSASQFSGGYGGREVTSSNRPPPSLHLNSTSSSPVSDRTPRTNQYNRPSEFISGNEKKTSGFKRPPPPFDSKPDPKKRLIASEGIIGGGGGKVFISVMKRCSQILGKLMNHKFGYIFNSPVDAIGLKLHDYHHIIKNPMDLGTVKMKLGKKLYGNPLDFASDVRLTFNNALTYNPKGHEVYVLAEELLTKFDRLFDPAYRKFENEMKLIVGETVVETKGDSFCSDEENPNLQARVSSPERSRTPDRMPAPRTIHPSQSFSPPPFSPPQPPPRTMAQIPGPISKPVIGRMGKLPRPKAKDPNKREMSFEEKQNLSESLQYLPQEKMDQLLHIIKRRNAELSQDGDEIEVDIEVMDKETLWELDRFVCNYKKTMNKMKRQALSTPQDHHHMAALEGNKSPLVQSTTEVPEVGKNKKGDNFLGGAEEDVDIGEEIPTSSFPPVEIEKDAGNGSSSSSSSSSGSSSSSDSDSGSSSGSDSEADDAQSPFVNTRASPRN